VASEDLNVVLNFGRCAVPWAVLDFLATLALVSACVYRVGWSVVLGMIVTFVRYGVGRSSIAIRLPSVGAGTISSISECVSRVIASGVLPSSRLSSAVRFTSIRL